MRRVPGWAGSDRAAIAWHGSADPRELGESDVRVNRGPLPVASDRMRGRNALRRQRRTSQRREHRNRAHPAQIAKHRPKASLGPRIAIPRPPQLRDEPRDHHRRQLATHPTPSPASHALNLACGADWFEPELERDGQGLDPGLARDGMAILRALPRSAGGTVLLCTDLHAGNVLSARREPWLVTTPSHSSAIPPSSPCSRCSTARSAWLPIPSTCHDALRPGIDPRCADARARPPDRPVTDLQSVKMPG